MHAIFSTKRRHPYLRPEDFRTEMFRMLAYHLKEQGCHTAVVGGYVDHVHLLFGLSRTIAVAKLVEGLKVKTSKWGKVRQSDFSWQSGYGAFSVSQSSIGTVEGYIRDQATHHADMSFKDEYRRICAEHGIDIDERFVWD